MRVAVQAMPIICTIIISIIEIVVHAKRWYVNIYCYNMRYGNAIGRKEWHEIKRTDPMLYNAIWKSNCYQGHCYYFSRKLAMHLQGAEVWYLSIKQNGEYISHAVIFKDGYIFDTNARMNIPYKEYMALNKAIIYKRFTKEEFEKEDFFNSIREDLIAYCREHNVYCNPE